MTKPMFVKFSDSTAVECRWSEFVSELFHDWEIIWDASENHYQGEVKFLAHKEGRFAYLTYNYGSCSGCDPWEDLPEDEVRADFKNLVEYFENVTELKKFADQVNYGEDFEKAIYDFYFYAQVDNLITGDKK